MQSVNWNVIYIATWFLIPIIPAYIFFKFLPDSAVVNGPFKGLKINLSGAFAAYFLLFLIAYPLMSRVVKNHDSPYEIWTINGSLTDDDGSKLKPSSQASITLIPSTEVINGEFNIDVIGTREESGMIRFPRISVSARDHVSDNLESLDYMSSSKDSIVKDSWIMNCASKTARLKIPFHMKSDPTLTLGMNTNTNPNLFVHADQ